MLKKIGIAVAVLIVVLLAMPAMLPGTVHVERSAQINVPPGAAYALLSDFNHFTKWSPWYEIDPGVKTEVTGQGVGSVYAWEGQQTGRGSMTITGLESNQRVDVKLAFVEPWQSEADCKWIITEDGAGSKVTWAFDQNLPYMMRYFGLTMDKMLGADFERGLAKLKGVLEN
ncbi:MAG TPA: SRPBCC family protein [Bdellovibrionales bacterium]|nr:SRPBCC family protein [Bdellovibrionales bacterium]